MEQHQAERIVYAAIDRVNELLLDESSVPKEPDTALLGPGAVLDSMGFVNFLVALEELLAQEVSGDLNLVGEINAPAPGTQTPESVSQFVTFIVALTRKHASSN